MELLNYWAILVCAVVAMVLGFVWYGPLFGKAWMRLTGCADMDEAKRKEMQKKAMPMYLVQFVLVLVQIFVLATYSITFAPVISVINALWIWLGFVMPTIAGSYMWSGDSRKNAWTKFFIQAGFQLVSFLVFGAILGLWQ